MKFEIVELLDFSGYEAARFSYKNKWHADDTD